MKRKIKFRGKRINNGEWVYGSLLISEGQINKGAYYICETVTSVFFDKERDCADVGGFYRVDPKTIGQFTGQTDKNGKEIYDGDICNCREYECYGKVAWNDDEAGFYFCISYEDGMFEEERLYDYADVLEIIGNIHDNPELLEV